MFITHIDIESPSVPGGESSVASTGPTLAGSGAPLQDAEPPVAFTSPSAAPAAGPWSALLGWLKWIALSLGLSGLMVVIGFLISFAYQERLGYHLGDSGDTVFYITQAGDFFITVFMLAANWAVDSPFAATAAIGLAVAIYFAWERWSPSWGPRVNASLLAGLFVAIAIKLLMGDLPTVPMVNELVLGLEASSAIEKKQGVASFANNIWKEQVCSRIERAQYGDLKVVGTDCTLSPKEYRDHGAQRFLWNVLATIAICLVATGLVTSCTLSSSRHFPVLFVPLSLLLLIDVLFQPYCYGKTAKSTLTDEIIVVAALESEGATPHHGFLLAQAAKDLVVFDKESKQVLMVPRIRIHYIRVEGSRDILEFYFKTRLSSAAASQTAAPPG